MPFPPICHAPFGLISQQIGGHSRRSRSPLIPSAGQHQTTVDHTREHTMNTTSTKHSAEGRKAQAEALHASILEQVEQLAESGQWRRFLDFARSFHQYSLNNLLLILAQNPDATMVAGYRQWQAKGRQVRKSESAIKIFGHSTKKMTTNDDEHETAERQEQRIVHYFPVLSVFDISQTDPIPGATHIPANPAQQLRGDDDHGIFETLTAYLQNGGWDVRREPLTHANGYIDRDRHVVVIGRDLAPEHAAKTLIHETAHIALQHIDDVNEYRQHRGRMEVEAESVAYVTAGLNGFDTSAYSIGYIIGWASEDLDLVRETAARVLRCAQTLAQITD
ncbi:ArdC-like ssDNA-binding domain-containing protein [Leifsonia sp. NPDC058292]|uniref:ArdC-like ssDNA-binding domain-containing protein n=1 Tax=Leifsonia sp. NPDC058292 TaxID=3346428 RepID=UPI0036D78187